MIAAINILGKVKNKRKIALLGDMLELGEYEEQLHRSLAKQIIDNNIDIVITVGPLTQKYLTDELQKNNYKKEVYSFNKSEDTYELLNKTLKENDIILLKGSNSMHINKIVDTIK